MDQLRAAQHELDRLQAIITRHEGFIFTIRGWLLTVVGGLLAAYYTDNIQMNVVVISIALPLVAVLFLLVESRHTNLVESVVERATKVEEQIAKSHLVAEDTGSRWYDGPKVSEACLAGVNHWLPKGGMTFVLNKPFYFVVIFIIIFATISLPPKGKPAPGTGTTEQQGKP